MTAQALLARKSGLQSFLQAIGSNPSTLRATATVKFFSDSREAYIGGFQKFTVNLPAFLVDGSRVCVQVSSVDSTDTILLKLADELKMKPENTYAFGLFLVNVEKEQEFDTHYLMRQLHRFECPSMTLSQANLSTPHRLVLRKCYWSSHLDKCLFDDDVALRLIYLQALTDLHAYSKLLPSAISDDLPPVTTNGDNVGTNRDTFKTFLLKAPKQVPCYGCLHLTKCLANVQQPTSSKDTLQQAINRWGTPTTYHPSVISIGARELVIAIDAASGGALCEPAISSVRWCSTSSADNSPNGENAPNGEPRVQLVRGSQLQHESSAVVTAQEHWIPAGVTTWQRIVIPLSCIESWQVSTSSHVLSLERTPNSPKSAKLIVRCMLTNANPGPDSATDETISPSTTTQPETNGAVSDPLNPENELISANQSSSTAKLAVSSSPHQITIYSTDTTQIFLLSDCLLQIIEEYLRINQNKPPFDAPDHRLSATYLFSTSSASVLSENVSSPSSSFSSLNATSDGGPRVREALTSGMRSWGNTVQRVVDAVSPRTPQMWLSSLWPRAAIDAKQQVPDKMFAPSHHPQSRAYSASGSTPPVIFLRSEDEARTYLAHDDQPIRSLSEKTGIVMHSTDIAEPLSSGRLTFLSEPRTETLESSQVV